MVRIEVFENPFIAESPAIVNAESVAAWLITQPHGVIRSVFRGKPSSETDISQDIQALLSESGDYTVLVSPGSDNALAFLGPIGLSFLAGKKLVEALIPKPPAIPGNINRTQQSPNNALAARSNESRVLQRIEDIFGTVTSYPTLLQPVYSVYENNREIQHSLMCIGRGYYEIPANRVRDGDTLISSIAGSGARFFNPFTSPNSGEPFLEVGAPITEGIYSVAPSKNVTGQTLEAPNQIITTNGGSFVFTKAADSIYGLDTIESLYPVDEFFELLSSGRTIIVSGSASHDGTYTASAIYGDTIVLDSSLFSTTSTESATLTNFEGEWSDWVVTESASASEIWCNIVAPNGIWADGGEGKGYTGSAYEIQVQEIDSSGNPVGDVIAESGSLVAATSDEQAVTVKITTAWTGSSRTRVRRTTPFPYEFEGAVVDEIKWASLYAVTPVTQEHFGNVTTVQTVTRATARALSLKERVFNCRVTRRIPIFDGVGFSGAFAEDGSIASGTISGSNRFIDILAAAAVDPYIGRRNISTDIDMAQIYSVYQQVSAWNPLCAEFSYTLDSDDISFEETVQMMAESVFCVAYRQNGKIRFSFDREQPTSTALFAHRNKKPASDSITRQFFEQSGNDGVEYSYNDIESDAFEVIRLPLDGNSTNPVKVEAAGVRNFAQAWYAANRIYQKQNLSRITIETETTADGRLLLPNQRIEIVDNTRFDAQDGEVIAQDGLVLTLSRDLTFSGEDGAIYLMTEDGFALATESGEYIILEEEDPSPAAHSIILMRRDGSLESIPVTAGPTANKVILEYAPAEAINTTNGGDAGVRTIFSFGADTAYGANSYLVQETTVSDESYVRVIAINYDSGYFVFDNSPVPERGAVL